MVGRTSGVKRNRSSRTAARWMFEIAAGDVEGVVPVLFVQRGGVLQERIDAERHVTDRARRDCRLGASAAGVWASAGRTQIEQHESQSGPESIHELFIWRTTSEDGRRAGAEVAVENRHRVDARATGRAPGRRRSGSRSRSARRRSCSPASDAGRERGRGAVQAAAHRAAEHHHQTRGAVIGAGAAVLRDPAAELREDDDRRVVGQALVADVAVEAHSPSPSVPIRLA